MCVFLILILLKFIEFLEPVSVQILSNLENFDHYFLTYFCSLPPFFLGLQLAHLIVFHGSLMLSSYYFSCFSVSFWIFLLLYLHNHWIFLWSSVNPMQCIFISHVGFFFSSSFWSFYILHFSSHHARVLLYLLKHMEHIYNSSFFFF